VSGSQREGKGGPRPFILILLGKRKGRGDERSMVIPSLAGECEHSGVQKGEKKEHFRVQGEKEQSRKKEDDHEDRIFLFAGGRKGVSSPPLRHPKGERGSSLPERKRGEREGTPFLPRERKFEQVQFLPTTIRKKGALRKFKGKGERRTADHILIERGRHRIT